jgi:repressor LexA
MQSASPSLSRCQGGPTRQQGQFLAFIREYMIRNDARIAPSHADLQRFFNLTPPSVNSMLIRLQQRGFIRRTPIAEIFRFILTHPEMDHLDGFDAFMDAFSIHNYWDSSVRK